MKSERFYEIILFRVLNFKRELFLFFQDCSTGGSEPVSDNSGNLQMTILIICLVLVVVILLLIVVFFLYRRRMLCFGTLKRGRSKDDHTTVHVELHERDETVADSAYDKVNNEQIGNPLYSSADKSGDKQPMLSPVRKKAGPVDKIKMPGEFRSSVEEEVVGSFSFRSYGYVSKIICFP